MKETKIPYFTQVCFLALSFFTYVEKEKQLVRQQRASETSQMLELAIESLQDLISSFRRKDVLFLV